MSTTSHDTMRAAAIDRFGDSGTITVQALPTPDVGPDEVLIRVESAGVGVDEHDLGKLVLPAGPPLQCPAVARAALIKEC